MTYSERSDKYTWTYNWSINTSNTFLASLLWVDGLTTSSFDVVGNADNSGSFKYFEATALKADINWRANGTGTYWISSDGGTDISGSWTAK